MDGRAINSNRLAYLMKYVLDFGADVLNIHMEGDFTFADSRMFKHLVSMVRALKKHQQIHLHITKLKFIDASAISLFLMIHDFAKRHHITLLFIEPVGQVRTALTEAANYNALRICMNEASA